MSNRDQEPGKTSALSQWPQTAYHLLLGAMWVSAFLPEARLWGINWYRYFGWPGLTVLLVGGLAAPWVIDRIGSRSGPETVASNRDRRYLAGALATIIIFALGFVLLVGRTHFLGDGYQVLGKIQAGVEVIKPWDSAVWMVQTALYRLVGGAGEADALLSLRAISIGSGIFMLIAVAFAARRLFESNPARIFLILSLGTGGYMLLFFGYVENYPLFVLCVSVFCLTGLLASRARWSLWAILVPLIPAMLLHPLGVSLLPGAAYLLGRGTRLGRWLDDRSGSVKWTLILAGSVVAFLAVASVWRTNLFFRFSLVPPVADQFTVEGYTLFSMSHILDYANLIFMLCPGLPLALILLTRLPVRNVLKRPEYRFLGLCLASAMIAVGLFNPRLGMPRDWDLFAFVGVPLMLLTSLVVLEQWGNREARTGGWLMVVLGLLVLGPRVASQAIPDASIAVFDHFAELDVIKSRNGRFLLQEYLKRHDRMSEHTRRARVNTLVLPYEQLSEKARMLGDQGRLAEAADGFRRAIALDPTYHYAWSNLGVVYSWLEQFDSALICLHIADGLNPYSFSNNMKLAGTYSRAGDDIRAEVHWHQAARLMPDDLECRFYLLRLYRNQARWTELDSLTIEVTSSDSLSLDILEPIIRRQLELGDTIAGTANCRQALELGLDTAEIVNLQREFPQLRLVDPDWTSGSDSSNH